MEQGLRLDQAIRAVIHRRSLPSTSARQIKRWIEEGEVWVNGEIQRRASFKVSGQELIEFDSICSSKLTTSKSTPSQDQKRSSILSPLLFNEIDRVAISSTTPSAEMIYQDEWMIVLNKPTQTPTTPTYDPHRLSLYHHTLKLLWEQDQAEQSTLPQSIPYLKSIPYLRAIHRLDLGTTGVVVMARHPKANRPLSEAFREHTAHKVYWALCVQSRPPRSRLPQSRLPQVQFQDQGLFQDQESDRSLLQRMRALSLQPLSPIERCSSKEEESTWFHLSAPLAPIDRAQPDHTQPDHTQLDHAQLDHAQRDHAQHTHSRSPHRSAIKSRWRTVNAGGKAAHTLFKIIARSSDLYWIAARPLTGRTHQIRVHLRELGYSILGDDLYGDEEQLSTHPLHLHARSLTLPHPHTDEEMTFYSPLPKSWCS